MAFTSALNSTTSQRFPYWASIPRWITAHHLILTDFTPKRHWTPGALFSWIWYGWCTSQWQTSLGQTSFICYKGHDDGKSNAQQWTPPHPPVFQFSSNKCHHSFSPPCHWCTQWVVIPAKLFNGKPTSTMASHTWRNISWDVVWPCIGTSVSNSFITSKLLRHTLWAVQCQWCLLSSKATEYAKKRLAFSCSWSHTPSFPWGSLSLKFYLILDILPDLWWLKYPVVVANLSLHSTFQKDMARARRQDTFSFHFVLLWNNQPITNFNQITLLSYL